MSHDNASNMSKLDNENLMCTDLIKIEENLPWIELTEAFQTRIEAQTSAKEKLNTIKIEIVKLP